MNITSFGNTVAKLRKKHGYTQSQLASMLNVSNKAVSKWETGGGYPEITLLPALSEILKVSIDYLLKGDTKGITIAGNILVDIVNIIDTFPKPGMLTNITETVHAVGGCVPNTIIDIAKIDSEIETIQPQYDITVVKDKLENLRQDSINWIKSNII